MTLSVLAQTPSRAPSRAPEPEPAHEAFLTLDKVERAFVYRRATLTRPAKSFNAVDGVSLSLKKGETLAVVGESGCGKSTLGRLASGLMRPTGGRVNLDGISFGDLSADGWRDSRTRVQVIFQDAAGSLDPRLPVEVQVREPLDLHNVGTREERRRRTEEMLRAVKLGRHLWKAVPGELSGGQQQRVVIARALILEPGLLICDEPVSALDVSIQAQIISLLADMRARLGLTMIFISHDLAVVRQIADRVAVMYLGQIVEEGPIERLFSAPMHPYTRALLAAVPVPDPAVKRAKQILMGDPPSPHAPPSGCRFHTRCPIATERCGKETPEMRIFGPVHVACHHAEDRS